MENLSKYGFPSGKQFQEQILLFWVTANPYSQDPGLSLVIFHFSFCSVSSTHSSSCSPAILSKNQFAASSAIKVASPAVLSFYGRETSVEVSAPLLIPNIGMTDFLMQVLYHFRKFAESTTSQPNLIKMEMFVIMPKTLTEQYSTVFPESSCMAIIKHDWRCALQVSRTRFYTKRNFGF